MITKIVIYNKKEHSNSSSISDETTRLTDAILALFFFLLYCPAFNRINITAATAATTTTTTAAIANVVVVVVADATMTAAIAITIIIEIG